VSANFFTTLGVQPVLGRGFQEGEDQPGREREVVLSDPPLAQPVSPPTLATSRPEHPPGRPELPGDRHYAGPASISPRPPN